MFYKNGTKSTTDPTKYSYVNQTYSVLVDNMGIIEITRLELPFRIISCYEMNKLIFFLSVAVFKGCNNL